MDYKTNTEMAKPSTSQSKTSELERLNLEVEPKDKNDEVQTEGWLSDDDDIEQHDGEDGYMLARDKTRREIKPPNRYGYENLIAASEVLEDERSNDGKKIKVMALKLN